MLMKHTKAPNPEIVSDVYTQFTHALLWLDQMSVLVKMFKWQLSYENVQTAVKVTKNVSLPFRTYPQS